MMPPPFAASDDDDVTCPDEGGAPRFLAVGGGRGGVGKSLVAVILAVYFAQLGKSVVLVDADAAGANLHSHFGLNAAWIAREAFPANGADAMKRSVVPTSVPGLSLLPAAHDAASVLAMAIWRST
jgi:flagellar biosynthesis protein FlhG